MEGTVVLTIPKHWLGERVVNQDELRQALRLGLDMLQSRSTPQKNTAQVIQVMLRTGRIQHLPAVSLEAETIGQRQTPPTLPGAPVSEILIAQRRGEL